MLSYVPIIHILLYQAMIKEEALVKMPSLQPSTASFNLEPKNLVEEEDASQAYINLAHIIQGHLKEWIKEEDFQFELPKSQFDHKRQTPVIRYLDPKAVVDDIQVQPLSNQQKASITRDGTFVVNSRRYSIPYKWLINPVVYKGREGRWKEFIRLLSKAWQQLYYIPKRITDATYYLGFKYTFKTYWGLLRRLINIFIGFKAAQKYHKVQPYMIMELKRQKDLAKKYGESIPKSIYEYITLDPLQTHNPEKTQLIQSNKNKLSQIETQFSYQWSQVEEDWVDELSLSYTGWEYNQKLEEKKYEILYSIKQGVPPQVIEQLHFLLQQIRKIQRFQEKLQRTSKQIDDRVSADVRKQYPIKSQSRMWFSDELNRRKAPLLKANKQTLLQQLSRQMDTIFFQDYLEFVKNWDMLFEKTSQKVTAQNPLASMNTYYNMFPPYEVVEGVSYSLVKVKNYTFDTKKYFWLLQFYYYKVYTNTKQLFYQFVNALITGSFGLRVLFSTQKFYPQMVINSYTGEICWNPFIERTPIITSVRESIDSIKEARQKFQQAPDNGMLKKSYLRVFNLVYQYIFIGLLCTVIGLLIIKPLVCIFMITLTLFLALCSGVLALAGVLIRYLWNIFVLNTESYSYKPIDWFPIVTIPLGLVVTTIRLLLTILTIVVIHPLLCTILVLFAGAKFFFSTIYNEFVLFLIKNIGRSPVGQSSLAWKIDGPGISKNYVQQIKPDDIYILFQSECQKIQLEILRQYVFSKLNVPQEEATRLTQPFNKVFRTSLPYFERIQQSISFYNSKMNNQIAEHTQHYPRLDSSVVRFTQEQLNEYTGNCVQLLKTFMETREHSDMYKYFSMKKRKPQKLVIKIWERIFGNTNVFQAYEEKQERFQMLEDVRTESEIKNFMGKQKKFKKSGHKTFRYNDTSQIQNYVQPRYFSPISNLMSRIQQNSSINFGNSKDDLALSILINPYAQSVSRLYADNFDKDE